MNTQKELHEPVIRKISFQLWNRCSIQSTTTGAMAAPIDEPLSNSATAQPRSLRGNHSLTALVAPGQLADSPNPSKKRNEISDLNPTVSDVSAATIEYHVTLVISPTRVPTRSRNLPDAICPTPYARRKAISTQANFV